MNRQRLHDRAAAFSLHFAPVIAAICKGLHSKLIRCYRKLHGGADLCNIIDLPTSLKTQLISLTKRHFVKFSINFHSLFSPCAENFDLHRTAC